MPQKPLGCILQQNGKRQASCEQYPRSQPRQKNEPRRYTDSRASRPSQRPKRRRIRVNPWLSIRLYLPRSAIAANGAGEGLVERGLRLSVFLVGNLSLFVLHFE